MQGATEPPTAFLVGLFSWVAGNLAGALVYALSILLIAPLIMAGVVAAHFLGNVGRRRRGEPIKPFRWR